MKSIFLPLTLLLFIQVNAQKIIFTQQINNNDNLMLIDEKGDITKLTNHPGKDSSPMVSSDGKMVVFTSERVGWWKIWTLEIETGKTNQLTNSSSADYSPSWSPDGRSIVYTSTKDGNQEIYIMNANGSEKRNISNTSIDEVMPFWAKDGYIYFSAEIDSYYQVFKCKPDGSDRQQVTTATGDKLMGQPSPDGTQLLYYGNQDGNMEIYVMNLYSKETKRLTDHPLMDMRPRWSPDGNEIVFERGNKGDNHHIFIMNSDGSAIRQLTNKYYNYTPSFFPSR